MKIVSIRLRQFRNHRATEVSFGESINAVLGRNGQGKTNLVEALSFLCLTKSFYATGDQQVVQLGCSGFEIEGELTDDEGHHHAVVVRYNAGPREKIFTVNGVEPEHFSDVIGRFPVVVLSPDKGAITQGGPALRRRFLDVVLSQLSAEYLASLLEYRRVLKQRNALLAQGHIDTIDSWSEALANHGSRITKRRRDFLAEFAPYVRAAYHQIANGREEPGITYSPSPGIEENEIEEAIAARLREALSSRRSEELRLGTTAVGPHRDELKLELDGMVVQKFASQGQHKTFLVALKVAEFQYMRDVAGETPILLLDDVFSELDEERSRRLLETVSSLGQTVITATSEAVFRGNIDWNDLNKRLYVENGALQS